MNAAHARNPVVRPRRSAVLIESLEDRTLFASVAGSVIRETWTKISGTSTSVIPLTTTPTTTSVLTTLETPSNDGINYGDRIRGYLTAPTTGNYVFWIAGDDGSDFYLAKGTDPATKTRIAYVNGYAHSRQWTKFASQKSAAISLVAGQKYYFEILHKQSYSAANLAVGWSKPGQVTTAPSEVIPGSVLSTYDTVVTPPTTNPPTFSPTATPELSVQVSAGAVTLPSGATVQVQAKTLSFAAPTVVSTTYTGTIPNDWSASLTPGKVWSNVITPAPKVDTLLLGGLYKAIIPSSIVVKNAAGTVTYVEGVDYVVNPDWGQVANLNGRLGTPGSANVVVSYRYVQQRLDLIQVGADGVPVIKKGTSAVVVPNLPTADAGFKALAGIYVYTMDGARDANFTIRASEFFSINPAAPVQPINPTGVAKTLAKLKAGGSVNIAEFGDSITLGAEAGQWWSDRSKTYTGKVIAGLKTKYPSATITETPAYQGSLSATDAGAATLFTNNVLNAAKPVDLVIIALGMNDAGVDASGNIDTSAFSNAITSFVTQAKAKGIEVLLVSPIQSNPFLDALSAKAPRSAISAALKTIANTQSVAMADVYTEWMNQASLGIPPYSQLHNWINHPGVNGHTLYANTILRLF